MLKTEDYPNLSRPPIKLAIIEIRYDWLSSKDAATFIDFHTYIKNDFPTEQKGDHKNINLDNTNDGNIKATITKQYVKDYKFISADKKNVLLVSKERFSLNVQDNYTTWRDFVSKFKELWELFTTHIITSDQVNIKGISIRYINRIELEEVNNPSAYFNTTIYATEGVIPENVTSYMMHYRVLTPENIELLITQGIEPRTTKVSPYLFDIDVIKNNLTNNEDIWSLFENLRRQKNKVFFSNITDLTLSKLI